MFLFPSHARMDLSLQNRSNGGYPPCLPLPQGDVSLRDAPTVVRTSPVQAGSWVEGGVP